MYLTLMQYGMHTLDTLWGAFVRSDFMDTIEMRHFGLRWNCSNGNALVGALGHGLS